MDTNATTTEPSGFAAIQDTLERPMLDLPVLGNQLAAMSRVAIGWPDADGHLAALAWMWAIGNPLWVQAAQALHADTIAYLADEDSDTPHLRRFELLVDGVRERLEYRRQWS